MAIESLGRTLDANQKIRAERAMLDNIQSAVSAGGGPEEIIAAAMQPAGKKGMFGNFVSNMFPGAPVSGAQKGIVMAQLQNALTRSESLLTPGQQTEAAQVKAGLKSKAPTRYQTNSDSVINPIGGTPEQAALTAELAKKLDEYNKLMGTWTESFGSVQGITMNDQQRATALKLKGRMEDAQRDVQDLTRKLSGMGQALANEGPSRTADTDKMFISDQKRYNDPKTSPGVKKRLAERINNNPSTPVLAPDTQIDWMPTLDGEKKIDAGPLDNAYGQDAYKAALKKAISLAPAKGFKKESIVANFNRWWDELAEMGHDTPDEYGKLVLPRASWGDDGSVKSIHNQYRPSASMSEAEINKVVQDVSYMTQGHEELTKLTEEDDFTKLSNEQLDVLIGNK
jgi:hypothetical protein